MDRVFVLGDEGKPLAPTKSFRARKFLKQGKAKPIWNKFGMFGIQMLVMTQKEKPKTVLGCDFGTKFEGYSVLSGRENILNVMWKLPDKKKLVKKLEERRRLRRARRFRNCRRRECRFDNRNKKGFIAPSQLQIVNSRLKCISELFKCYPIDTVALEDVKFNHRDKKWGKNFSTVEIGKQRIKDYIRARVGTGYLIMFSGMDTQEFREKNSLHKSSDKSSKQFYSHCVDSFVIANELSNANLNEDITYVDDTYKYVRRRLHDTQPAKGGIREKYSTGNFKGIRKGTMCDYGQIVGGTKTHYWIRDSDNKRIGRTNINWLSHNFKTKEAALLPNARQWGIRAEQR
ncbi:RRXRR domain-containing protein [archaeon]|nr:RRXRR domain-containing protein [archaeon]